jgi:hypothetical protein
MKCFLRRAVSKRAVWWSARGGPARGDGKVIAHLWPCSDSARRTVSVLLLLPSSSLWRLVSARSNRIDGRLRVGCAQMINRRHFCTAGYSRLLRWRRMDHDVAIRLGRTIRISRDL